MSVFGSNKKSRSQNCECVGALFSMGWEINVPEWKTEGTFQSERKDNGAKNGILFSTTGLRVHIWNKTRFSQTYDDIIVIVNDLLSAVK